MLYMLLLYAFVSCLMVMFHIFISFHPVHWDETWLGWQVTKAALDSLGCSIGYQGLVPTWLAAAPLEVIESIEQPHSCQFQRKTYSHKAEIPQVLHSHALVGEAAKLDEINPNSPMFFKKKAIRGTILRYLFLIFFGHRGIGLCRIIQHQDWCIHNHQHRRW